MFGYIRPLECELKVRNLALYRAYYCGLCKTIGRRYGQGARAVLNYDCTFLAILLSAFSKAPQCETGGCFAKPYRAKRPIAPPQAALDYAADANVLLAYHQQADDWNDERKATALASKLLLEPAMRTAKKERPELAETIVRQIGRLSEVEREKTACTDVPADAFGTLMRGIVHQAPEVPQQERAPLEWMFYNLGRWIYLIDAWEDRAKDEKRGGFNPFLLAGMSREEAAFLLHVSLTEAEKGYDLLSIVSHKDLLDNIMRLGCRHRTREAMKEKQHESV